MSVKNWFKVSVLDGGNSPYNFHGSSIKTLEQMIADVENNRFLRIDDLIYFERGVYKEWSDWDKSLVPSVVINPQKVITIMQYKHDPRNFVESGNK